MTDSAEPDEAKKIERYPIIPEEDRRPLGWLFDPKRIGRLYFARR